MRELVPTLLRNKRLVGLFGLMVLVPAFVFSLLVVRAIGNEQLRLAYDIIERQRQIVHSAEADLNEWLFSAGPQSARSHATVRFEIAGEQIRFPDFQLSLPAAGAPRLRPFDAAPPSGSLTADAVTTHYYPRIQVFLRDVNAGRHAGAQYFLRLRAWTAGSGGFFASPIMVTMAGTRQIVAATQDSVIGVSLQGRVLWHYPWEGGGGSTTPVLHNGMIIVSALDRGVAAIRPTIRDGTWSVEIVWHCKEVSMYVSNPVVVADTLFGLSHRARGQFFAVDATTGEVLWLGHPREADSSAVVKTDRLLVLLNDDAELIVARPSRARFDPVVRYTVADSATWAQPTLSGNRIFVKDVTTLSLWTLDE